MIVALCAIIWRCPLVPVSLGAYFLHGKLRCEPVASDFFTWQTALWVLFIWQIELIAGYLGRQLPLVVSYSKLPWVSSYGKLH